MVKKIYILLISSSLCLASTGSVGGRITSAGLGLPGANISLIGSTLGAVTDSAGHYYLGNVPVEGTCSGWTI